MSEVFDTRPASDIRPGNVVCVGTQGTRLWTAWAAGPRPRRYMVTRRRMNSSDNVVLTMSDIESVLRISEFEIWPTDLITTVISEDI